MKKLSLTVFLVLLWCNVGFADLIVYNKCNVTFAIWKDDTQPDEYINLEIKIDTNNKLINISKASESSDPITKDQSSEIPTFDTSIIDKIWDIVNENDFNDFYGANIKNDEIYAQNRRMIHIQTPRFLRAYLNFSEILVVNTTTNKIKIYNIKRKIPAGGINFPRDFSLLQEIICEERLDKK